MEFLIFITIIISYCSLSSKISSLIDNCKKEKKYFPSLSELVGKKIKIETIDEVEYSYDYKTTGILIEFDDKWIVLESHDKKNRTIMYYYKLSNVTSINIIND